VYALVASAVALACSACGGSGDPSTTAATQAESTTTAGDESSPSDAADFLGASLTAATAGEPGVVVQSVDPDSETQLARGDVIVAVDGTPVASPSELRHEIGSPNVGEQFTIKVVRGSHRFTLTEVQSPSAYLGAQVKDATGDVREAAIVAVTPKSPASAAGLERGDVITAVDDAPVRSADDLLQAISAHRPGDEVAITVSRDSDVLKLTATLADRPTPGGNG
jgi:S1-C subfamily serine protease